MFLNQENRNRKQKRVFTTFHEKNTFLFLDTSKRRKKRNRVEKKNQKKAGYKNEKPFFQDTEKDQTWKNMKKPKRKGNRENEVFLRWKEEKIVLQKFKKIFSTKSLTQRT